MTSIANDPTAAAIPTYSTSGLATALAAVKAAIVTVKLSKSSAAYAAAQSLNELTSQLTALAL